MRQREGGTGMTSVRWMFRRKCQRVKTDGWGRRRKEKS